MTPQKEDTALSDHAMVAAGDGEVFPAAEEACSVSLCCSCRVGSHYGMLPACLHPLHSYSSLPQHQTCPSPHARSMACLRSGRRSFRGFSILVFLPVSVSESSECVIAGAVVAGLLALISTSEIVRISEDFMQREKTVLLLLISVCGVRRCISNLESC